MVLGFARRVAQRSASARASSHARIQQQTPWAAAAAMPSTSTHAAAAAAATRYTHAIATGRSQSAARSPTLPPHLTGDVTAVLAGVAVVGALVGVGKMWWDASSSPSGSATGKHPAASLHTITRDDIKAFFEELKASIEQLFTQLPEIDEAFRKHLKSQNVELGADEYKQTLLQQLFDVLQNIEQQVVGARGWDPESFARAMEQFADDDEIVQVQKELQQIMHKVFPPPELPEDLTPDKALEIMTVLVQGMEQAMVDMLKHARAEGITDPVKAMEEFQHIYLEQVEQLTFQQMKKHNVSSDIFNVALQKFHAENAEFRKKVEQLYAEQAESFRRMGLDVQ